MASQLPADELKRLTGRLHDDLKKLNLQQHQQGSLSAGAASQLTTSGQLGSAGHPLGMQLDTCNPASTTSRNDPASCATSFWTQTNEERGGARTSSNERVSLEDRARTAEDQAQARTDDDWFSSLGFTFLSFLFSLILENCSQTANYTFSISYKY